VRNVKDAVSGEPDSDEGNDKARRGNLFFSTDSATCIGSADVIFLAVNTPTKYSGRGAGSASDLSALESAVRDIAKFAKNGTVIVEKSTVTCGTAGLIGDIVSPPQILTTRPQH
jgi:UDPglucose 6-dehydrogenase